MHSLTVKVFRCMRCELSIAPVAVNYHSCPHCGEYIRVQAVSIPVPKIPVIPDACRKMVDQLDEASGNRS